MFPHTFRVVVILAAATLPYTLAWAGSGQEEHAVTPGQEYTRNPGLLVRGRAAGREPRMPYMLQDSVRRLGRQARRVNAKWTNALAIAADDKGDKWPRASAMQGYLGFVEEAQRAARTPGTETSVPLPQNHFTTYLLGQHHETAPHVEVNRTADDTSVDMLLSFAQAIETNSDLKDLMHRTGFLALTPSRQSRNGDQGTPAGSRMIVATRTPKGKVQIGLIKHHTEGQHAATIIPQQKMTMESLYDIPEGDGALVPALRQLLDQHLPTATTLQNLEEVMARHIELHGDEIAEVPE